MIKSRGVKKYIAAAVLLVVIITATIVILQLNKTDAGRSAGSTDTVDQTPVPTGTPDASKESVKTIVAEKPTVATVDPETLNSVAIEPLGVTVFYTKGTPGFDFTVLKAAANTQFVQFTSPDLIGTKCTDDEGVFASIIKDATDSEAQTISETVKLGSSTFGLVLATAGCTGNVELLQSYQDGFKAGFSSLTAL